MIFEFCRDRFGITLERLDQLEYKNGSMTLVRKSKSINVKFKLRDVVELFELMESNRLTKTGIEIFVCEEANWDDDDYIYFVSTVLKDHFEIYTD